MVEYGPKPDRLDRMNPIQRYMQKGSLEFSDYIWLLIVILAYIALRPHTQKFMKWLLAPKDVKDGDEALKSHYQSKASVNPNTIRGGKAELPTVIPENDSSVAASSSAVVNEGQVSNRKAKNSSSTKTEEEKLIDWDDEPARQHFEGEKSDVIAWLDKWDK
jgi:hypothetical protein